MEHLDPSGPEDAEPWNGLSDRQREFYRLCVEALFSERALSRLALK